MKKNSPSFMKAVVLVGLLFLAGLTVHATGFNLGAFWKRLTTITPTSVSAVASIVPSDGLAQAFFIIYPRDALGVPYGAGATVEVTSSSTTVTMSGNGACRTPSAYCTKAYDAGNGTYYAYAVSSTVQSPTFSTVVAGTPDFNTGVSVGVTFDSAQYTIISSGTTITNAAHGGRNLYFTGGTSTFDSTTVGQSFGHLFVRGGTLRHTATNGTTMYKLDVNASSLTLQSGSINADGLGYPVGYSFGSSAPSTALAAGNSDAGSHGGRGGSTTAAWFASGVPYDDYRNPSYPGGGASSPGGVGGGVVRVTATGSCAIQSGATVTANAGAFAGTTGAGGSVYLNCAGFAGTAAANAILAKGATPTNAGYSGGGGRIAFISTGSATSFTGSFDYNSSLSTFKSRVSAEGGRPYASNYGGGGAGTIYIKHTGLTYGDMIINNNGQTYGLYNKNTDFVSMYGTVNGAPGATTLPVSATPALSANYVNFYTGMKLRPDLAYTNGTSSDWSDDNVLTVASNSNTTLTMNASFSGVANGASFRSIDIFDHLEVSDTSAVFSYGDIYVLSGSLTSPGPTLSLVNGLLTFGGSASVNPVVSNYTFSSGTFTFSSINPTAQNNILVSGATATFGTVTASSVSVSSGTLTATAISAGSMGVSGGTGTIQNITTTGDLTISGGTLNHPSTTTATVYRLQATVGGNFLMSGGTINVNGLGYTAGYSFGASGPSNTLLTTNGGGSHGGRGGANTAGSTAGAPFDDYRNPNYPGGGGSSSGGGGPGGGVVRITTTGSCTINSGATITANAIANSWHTGAGGSIYMNCASFAGTAGAGAITAKSVAPSAGSYYSGAGGRIALISTGNAGSFSGNFDYNGALTTFKSTVNAEGGRPINSGYGGGGAGTIYLMHSGLTYGDMLINNNSQTFGTSNANTDLISMYGTVNGAPGATTLPVSSTPGLVNNYVNVYAGMRLRPDLAYTNGTSSDWSDDNVITVASNTSTTLTMTASFSGVANGASFRSIDIFDHLEVTDTSVVNSYGDIYVLSGSLTSPGSSLSLTNALLVFNGSASVNPTVTSYTLSSGNFNYTGVTGVNLTAQNNIVISGTSATFGTMTANSISVSSGTLTATTINAASMGVSGGTSTVQNITTTGDFTISGGTLNHPATTSSIVYRLQATVGGNFLMSGGTINVNGLGYLAGYSFGASGPSNSLLISSYGGSHGGRGGATTTGSTAGAPFDDYRNPNYPGGGGASGGSPGGGVVRITTTGSCTINTGASITANANATSGHTGAGGSIYMNCASFTGTAAAGAITAKSTAPTSTYYSGGGGRIALISTGNAASFGGNFDYNGALATFKSRVNAEGGRPYNSSYGGGGAGTIYLMHSGLTYGDMLINNNGQTAGTLNANTDLISMYGTVNGAPGATTLPVSSTPGLVSNYVNVYAGMRLRPDLAYTNGTANDWTDDNVVTVASNTATVLTMTASFSGVANGASFRSIDIFDHLEVTDTSILNSYGDIYVLSGSLATPGSMNLTNSLITFNGSGSLNSNIDYVFSSGTYNNSGASLTANNITVNGATVNFAGMTANTMSVNSGTLTVQNLTTAGNFTITGGTVTHPATTSTTVYRLQATIGGNFLMSGGTINANNVGYTGGFSYGSSAPATNLAASGSSGSSHGGGGGTPANSGPTYDDYRNPNYPGGGTGSGSVGGGVVRITTTGSCTINSGASITANGQGSTQGAAGGSIYLNCASFAGTAGAAAISAKGGTATSTASGGGGRIALISTGNAASFGGNFDYNGALSTFKSTVTAEGGRVFNASWGGGGAGTIYLKHSGITHGDMIINNNAQTYSVQNGNTDFVSIYGTVNGAPGATTLPVTATPTLNANYVNFYAGMKLRPDLAYTNGTSSDWSDDNVIMVASNTSSVLTMTASFSGVANGASFRSIDIFDHLEMTSSSTLSSYGDIYVLNGSLTAPGSNLSLTNAWMTFNGSASINPTITDYTFNSGTFSASSSNLTATNFTVSGATVTFAGITASAISVNSGTLTVQNLTTTGNFTITGGTVNHPATTTSTTYRLQASIGGNFLMSGGTINVNNLGYTGGFSYGSSAPATNLAAGGSAGGSHGGGGGYPASSGATYDDYRNPNYPGGGTGSGSVGGGVVRITTTGSCTINSGASITANGQGSTQGAAGGSIYLNCASFAGTAGAAALSAKGGTATSTASGGGGRIALISTGNAASFGGNFDYNASLSTFKSTVTAEGGRVFNASWGGGGAGTIYLKHSGLTYGDLIINNNAQTYSVQTGNTDFVSIYGTVNGAPGATTLPVTATPTIAAGYVNLYAGMRLRPDLAYTNGTSSDWSDDNVITVASNTTTVLTMTASFSGVANGASYRSIDILDHLEVTDTSIVSSYGDIYVLSGTLNAPGSLNLANAGVVFNGSASINPAPNYTFSSGTLTASTTSLPSNNFTVSGATVTLGAITANGISVSSGTLTTQNITATGDMTISGGTVNHPATTTSTTYRFQATVGGNFLMSGGTINVNNLGYTGGFSYGSSAPSSTLAASGSSGSSHGGRGGTPANAGATYGDYRNPNYPGGGTGSGSVGGGVVRITTTGSCTINSGASITANGQASLQGAAGGSIYLNCASFAGTAGAGALSAKGGTATSTGSGGGGRIALISTGNAASFGGNFDYNGALATFKSTVTAEGGRLFSASWGAGGAGTIYLKHSGLTYGDLIINNNGQTYNANNGNTDFVSIYGTVNGAPGATTLPVTATPTISAGYVNLYAGMKLRPDLAYTNGTSSDWSDDNVLTVASNTTSVLTMTASFSGVANGASYRSIDILDHLELTDTSNISSYGDIYVLNGSVTSPGATLSLTNAFISFNGSASINPTITDYTFNSGTVSFSTSNLAALNNVTVSGGTAVFAGMTAGAVSVGSGTLTTQSLTTTGDFTINGGTVNHLATTSGTVYKLQATVGGNFLMSGGTINVNNLGYMAGYSYGSAAPSTALISSANSGSSHGGRGSYTTPGATYDDYSNPNYPGAGSQTGVGGGVVRITTTGSCTINSGASITANGQAATIGAAGGSIYMSCASFAGTAGAGALSAKGGTGTSTGSGGGGRIALISTGDGTSFTGNFAYASALATFKSTVTAEGGRIFSATYGGGGAGTIYVKHSGLTYGDLIIDNNSLASNAQNGKTALVTTTVNSSTIYSSTATKLQITNASTPLNNMTNLFLNHRVHVFTTASSANPLDGSHYEATITSNDTNNFYATAASFPAISNNHYYRIVYKLDHLDIGGNAALDITGGDLMLMTTASQPCDLHSASNAQFAVPAGSSVIGNSLASSYCSAALVSGTVTFTNTYLQP